MAALFWILNRYPDATIAVMGGFALVSFILIVPAVIYLTQGPAAARESAEPGTQELMLRELAEMKKQVGRIADVVERLEKRTGAGPGTP